ncbi:hypothetical protein HJ01_03590 [Flavobacterium frigoris PS1]|uniref:Uncharacterized protein n=1 Tax=Flavobacterium frigoris (strain PS1) TaxID=1086011 RepID=H7FLF4_FLAFP|nr:hypothetical protein HJ01_03590 [Flavobacterium frigoris PS1]
MVVYKVKSWFFRSIFIQASSIFWNMAMVVLINYGIETNFFYLAKRFRMRFNGFV